MNPQPPTYALNLDIDRREYVAQAVPPNSNNHQNTSTPKTPQIRWRMPDERIELICQYLTRASQEKQLHCDQAHKYARCTRQPTLLPHEMEFFVRFLVKYIKARGQLYSSNIIFTRRDWNTTRQAFNSKFKEDTNLSVLECAMRKERYKYVIALFRERCETAKEEQPELGEEYWHWMDV